MIKTPGSHTDRIAQACDRCRSKKIRCDGKRPHCSQCLSVGFECKTSDKLSRRAFPRGYTESLEDRVRQLESENTKLLNLLDIKDEQMEMLSKVESLGNPAVPNSPNTAPKAPPAATTSPTATPATPTPVAAPAAETPSTSTPASTSDPKSSESTAKLSSSPPNFSHLITNLKSAPPVEGSEEEEAYVVHQINALSAEGTYRGSAAGGVFIDAFIEKLKTKNCSMIPQLQQLFGKLNTPYSHDPNTISNSNSSSSYSQAPSPLDASTPLGMPITPASIASPISPTSTYTMSHSHRQSATAATTTPFFTNINIPSRLSADKLTATYFHEWNTMYAVLDQYAYLEQYQNVMNALSSAEVTNNYDHPDLIGNELFIIISLLVASLGSLALKDKSAAAIAESWRIEREWKRLFTAELQTTSSLAAVQALVLAELYSLHTGNQDEVWHYRMMAAAMTQRLGLHRCHKSLKLFDGQRLPFYEQEMRRRIFWVAYSLDCFSSALLGAPRLLNDGDIECALPSNIDDEFLRNPEAAEAAEAAAKAAAAAARARAEAEKNKGEKNASPPPAATTTQMTCPLSVIHFAKVFGEILDTIYSSVKRSHPYKTVVMLEDKLESWRRDLPAELKFEFSNGMPAATLVTLHQKSPLLLVMYHYARVLIHMPAISAPSLGTNAGARGSASCVAVMQSSKVVIQVMNYLKARCVVPTLCMNTPRFTVFFGAVVLYGAIDYSRGGALLLEIRKIMASAITHLYSDLQLHRPGSLMPESYQIFEEACDTLLNSSSRKNEQNGPRKRRSTVTAIPSKQQTKPTNGSSTTFAVPSPVSTPANAKFSPPVAPVNIAPQPAPAANSSLLEQRPAKRSSPNFSPAMSPPLPTPSPTETSGPSKLRLELRADTPPEDPLDDKRRSSAIDEDDDMSVHIKKEPDLEIDQLLSCIPSPTQLEKESSNNARSGSLPRHGSTTTAAINIAHPNGDSNNGIHWTSEVEHLRNNAINDLLMLNSLASGRSRSTSTTSHTSSNSSSVAPTPQPSNSNNNTSSLNMMDNVPIMNPIDLFFDSGMISSGKSQSNSNGSNGNNYLAMINHVNNNSNSRSNSSSSSSLSKLTESLAAAASNLNKMSHMGGSGNSGTATPMFFNSEAAMLGTGPVSSGGNAHSGGSGELLEFFNHNVAWNDPSIWTDIEDTH